MFESLNQESRLNGMRRFASLLLSLAVHAAVLGALVVLPMVFFNVMPADGVLAFVAGLPPTPVPPPPPAPMLTGGSNAKSVFSPLSIDVAPRTIPIGITLEDDAPVIIGINKLIEGIGIPGQGAASGPGIGAILDENKPIIPTPPRPPEKKPLPIRMGGDLQASKLIYRPDPVYPPLAIRARVSGTVILEALIDEEGNVADVAVLKGHPLLTEAAVQAVRQWKYTPTILNGEPIPVVAAVTLIFRIR